jgi:hypothetical protein
MSKIEQQTAFLKDAAKLILKAADIGLTITGGELFRTAEQQAIHLKAGKTRLAHSLHQDRLAIDLNFFKVASTGFLELTYSKSDIQPLGDFWESLNPLNKWGGNFVSFLDTPHFQRSEVK